MASSFVRHTSVHSFPRNWPSTARNLHASYYYYYYCCYFHRFDSTIDADNDGVAVVVVVVAAAVDYDRHCGIGDDRSRFLWALSFERIEKRAVAEPVALEPLAQKKIKYTKIGKNNFFLCF